MKGLNILLGCDNLKSTGTGTFIYSLNNELLKRGHDVDIFTFNNGLIGSRLPNLITNISKNSKYDLLILSQKNIVDEILKLNVSGFKIYVSLMYDNFDKKKFPNETGPFNEMNRVVTLSEESQNKLQSNGVKSSVIFMGYDCNRFRPIKPIKKEKPRILSAVRGETANKMIKQACEILDLEFVSWLKPWDYVSKTEDGSVADVEKWINKSDIVIGLGRVVYEAMACGRQPIIFDDRWYQGNLGDGIVTPDNIEKFREYNCSGRYSKRKFEVEDIVEEINLYNPTYWYRFRKFILENMNIVNITNQYLDIWKEHTGITENDKV